MTKEPSYGGQLVNCPKCHAEAVFTEHIDDAGYFDRRTCNNCGKGFVKGEGMQLYARCVYRELCPNGHSVTVLSQPNDNPQYYTEVTVFCSSCEAETLFSLPVN